jgi:DNA-binding response OmpR family regulator
MRILLAESDAAVRETLIATLEARSLVCDAASDGIEALRRVDEQRYDLLLIDLGLPHLEAENVFRRIGELGWAPRPVVVAIAVREDVRSLDAEVVQIVLRRPLELAQVADLVESCLQVSPRRAEAAEPRSDDRRRDEARESK